MRTRLVKRARREGSWSVVYPRAGRSSAVCLGEDIETLPLPLVLLP